MRAGSVELVFPSADLTSGGGTSNVKAGSLFDMRSSGGADWGGRLAIVLDRLLCVRGAGMGLIFPSVTVRATGACCFV